MPECHEAESKEEADNEAEMENFFQGFLFHKVLKDLIFAAQILVLLKFLLTIFHGMVFYP